MLLNPPVMTLKDLKSTLQYIDTIIFQKPDGSFVPLHFHITEVGTNTRNFIDCGGKVREEKRINLQLWEAADFDHKLSPEKLISIIESSEKSLGISDALTVEVEYQSTTIGRYGLDFDGKYFQLKALKTACLAEDACGIPQQKPKIQLTELGKSAGSSCCEPGTKCC